MRGREAQGAADVRAGQLYPPGCGKPFVEVGGTADAHPRRDERIPFGIGSADLGTPAAQLSGDVRSGQPDRTGCGEPVIEQNRDIYLQLIGYQSTAISIRADLRAGTAQRPGDLRSGHPDRAR
jgi:hypothetical protein